MPVHHATVVPLALSERWSCSQATGKIDAMKTSTLVAPLLLLIAFAPRSVQGQNVDSAPVGSRATVLRRESPERLRGDQVVMLSVEYPPGAISPRHSHPGPTFVYIVEGTICSEVKGQPPRLYSAGDSFYEPEGGWHAVRNQSGKTVRLVAYIIAPAGAVLAAPVDNASMTHSLAPTCSP
jgi:quercetin dioxygenase-like cupin family protein